MTHIPETTANRQKNAKKGMSTENKIGVQTRAMAQWVDNNANPEQVQKTTDQATTPTVELHKTKEDTIKEFYDNKVPSVLTGMYQTSATLE